MFEKLADRHLREYFSVAMELDPPFTLTQVDDSIRAMTDEELNRFLHAHTATDEWKTIQKAVAQVRAESSGRTLSQDLKDGRDVLVIRGRDHTNEDFTSIGNELGANTELHNNWMEEGSTILGFDPAIFMPGRVRAEPASSGALTEILECRRGPVR